MDNPTECGDAHGCCSLLTLQESKGGRAGSHGRCPAATWFDLLTLEDRMGCERAVSDLPRYVRLTSEQVQSIVCAAQEGGTENVVMLLPEPLARHQLPPTAVWEERIREDADARLSLPLARGLLFLARLAESGPTHLNDLAADLNLSPGVTNRYAHTLVLAGLVKRDQDTSCYRLAR